MNHSLHTIIRRVLLVPAALLLASGLPAAAKEPAAPQQQSSKPPEYDKLKLPDLQARADAGDLAAQFELGSRYNYGRGLPKNTREALRWLRGAAQSGQTDAMRLLAVKCYGGYDVPVDFEEALLWAGRLAETGDRQAQLMLADMYGNGEGVARDLVSAYAWFDIAATLRPGEEPGPEAAALMATAVEKREQTIKLLLPDQEVRAQQQATEWWSKHYQPQSPPLKKSPRRPAS